MTLPVPLGSRAPLTPFPKRTCVLPSGSCRVTKTMAPAACLNRVLTSVQATPATDTVNVLAWPAPAVR